MSEGLSKPWEEMSKAVYFSTLFFEKLYQEEIWPLLNFTDISRDYPTRRFDLATVATYHRAMMWIMSIAKLDNTTHCQAVCNGARSMYECLIDLRILVAKPEMVEQFYAFPKVARYEMFKKYADLVKRFPDQTPNHYYPFREEFLDRPEIVAVYNGALAHFPDGRREHWTNRDMPSRIEQILKDIPELFRYREIYALLSWHVHSGVAGYAGMSHDGLASNFVHAHSLAQDFAAEMTDIMCKTHHLYTAKPELRDMLADCRQKVPEFFRKLPPEHIELFTSEAEITLRRKKEFRA